MFVTKTGDLLNPRAGRPGGAWHSKSREGRSHVRLVLGMEEGGRARAHGDPPLNESLEDFGRHLLVVKGDDVAAGRELEHGVCIEMGSDSRVADHLRGGIIRALCQHSKANAQRGGRLGRHSGELPTSDHADNRRLVLRHH